MPDFIFIFPPFLLPPEAVLNNEEDVAAYTVKAATDPRVANRVIIYRPPGNIVSQLDLISSWEKRTGQTLKKTHVPVEEIVRLSECKLPQNLNLLFENSKCMHGGSVFDYIKLYYMSWCLISFFCIMDDRPRSLAVPGKHPSLNPAQHIHQR